MKLGFFDRFRGKSDKSGHADTASAKEHRHDTVIANEQPDVDASQSILNAFADSADQAIANAAKTLPDQAAIALRNAQAPEDFTSLMHFAAHLKTDRIKEALTIDAPEPRKDEAEAFFGILREWAHTVEETRNKALTAAILVEDEERYEWLENASKALIRLGTHEKLDLPDVQTTLPQTISANAGSAVERMVPEADETLIRDVKGYARTTLKFAFKRKERTLENAEKEISLIDEIANKSFNFFRNYPQSPEDDETLAQGRLNFWLKARSRAENYLKNKPANPQTGLTLAGERAQIIGKLGDLDQRFEASRRFMDEKPDAPLDYWLANAYDDAATKLNALRSPVVEVAVHPEIDAPDGVDTAPALQNETADTPLSPTGPNVDALLTTLQSQQAEAIEKIRKALQESARTISFDMVPSTLVEGHLIPVETLKKEVGDTAQVETEKLIDKEIATALSAYRSEDKGRTQPFGPIFQIWVDRRWIDPAERWTLFRSALANAPMVIGSVGDQWHIEEMRKNLALGSAIRCINDEGETVLVPDSGLPLVHGRTHAERIPQSDMPMPGASQQTTFAYIDWARGWSGFAPSKEDKKGKGAAIPSQKTPKTVLQMSHESIGSEDALTILRTLKSKINELSEGRGSSSAFFTPREADPIAHWLKCYGDIEMAVDSEGLVAITLTMDENAPEKDPMRGLTRADNVATILAHLMRRALGDDVAAGMPRGSSEMAAVDKDEHGLIVYAVAPNEFIPIAVEPLDGRAETILAALTTTHPVAEATKPAAGAEASPPVPSVPVPEPPAALPVRPYWTGDAAQAPRAAAVALAERGVTRRNALVSAIESLKRYELNEHATSGRHLAAHVALFAAIPLLMGLFFGAIFAETVADVLRKLFSNDVTLGVFLFFLFLSGLNLCVVQYWALKGKYFPTQHADQVVTPTPAHAKQEGTLSGRVRAAVHWLFHNTEASTETSSFLNGFGGILIGLSIAAMPVPWNGEYVIGLIEAGLFGWALAAITGYVFFKYMAFDRDLQGTLSTSLFGAEHESVSTNSSNRALDLSKRDEALFDMMTLRIPVLLVLFVILLKTTPWLDTMFVLDGARNASAAQYRDVFLSLAWAMPVLGFGVLVSAWNRFGNTGLTTLGHQLALRRLKQAESMIREYDPLSTLLKRRNEGLHFVDIEKAANAIAPQAELVKAHEARTEARFVRSTALVAAAVVALLQIKAFESLKPYDAPSPSVTVDTWLRDAMIHAIAQPVKQVRHGAPGPAGGAGTDKGSSPDKPEIDCANLPRLLENRHVRACLPDPTQETSLSRTIRDMRVLSGAMAYVDKSDCTNCDPQMAGIHAVLRKFLSGEGSGSQGDAGTTEVTEITVNIYAKESRSLDWTTVANLVNEHEGNEHPPADLPGTEGFVARELLLLRSGLIDWREFCHELRGRIAESLPAGENREDEAGKALNECDISVGSTQPAPQDRAIAVGRAFARLLDTRVTTRGLDPEALASAFKGQEVEGREAETVLANILSRSLNRDTLAMALKGQAPTDDAQNLDAETLLAAALSRPRSLDAEALASALKGKEVEDREAETLLAAALDRSLDRDTLAMALKGETPADDAQGLGAETLLAAALVHHPRSLDPEALAAALKGEEIVEDREAERVLANVLLRSLDRTALAEALMEENPENDPEDRNPEELLAMALSRTVEFPDERGLDRAHLGNALASEDYDDESASAEIALATALRGIIVDPPPPLTGVVGFPAIPAACGGANGMYNGENMTVARIFFPFNRSNLKKHEDLRACIGSAELDSQFQPKTCPALLRTGIEDLKKEVGNRIAGSIDLSHLLVVGFSDTQGMPVGNIALSQKRARTIKRALGNGKFPSERRPIDIVDVGRGEEPGSRMMSSGWFRGANYARRVEVRLCRNPK